MILEDVYYERSFCLSIFFQFCAFKKLFSRFSPAVYFSYNDYMACFWVNGVRKKKAELEIFRFHENRLRLRFFEYFVRVGCTSRGSTMIFHI